MTASRRAPRAAFILPAVLIAALGTGCLLYYAAADPLADGDVHDDGAACKPSEKLCVGSCVSQNDPAVGCSGECSACEAPANAQPACMLEGNQYLCVQGSCGSQSADCDHDASDGCETDTTLPANCGACGHDCKALGYLYCQASDGGYECTNDCTGVFCGDASCDVDAGGPTCECAHFQIDDNNCGGCGISCVYKSGNGLGYCDAGQCTIVCNAGRCLNDKGNCPVADFTRSPNCGACNVTCNAPKACCPHGGGYACTAPLGASGDAAGLSGGQCNP